MSSTGSGSPAIWDTRALIEAWPDPDAVRAALFASEPHGPEVLRTLILVAQLLLEALAEATDSAFDEVLTSIWAQLAQSSSDDDASRLMRAAITAWCSGDGTAEDLNASGALLEVDPRRVILHLVSLTHQMTELLSEELGKPVAVVRNGIWKALGTESDGQ